MFSELKVLELASVLAGPSVGQFFAELGAAVIKVENIHTGGDVTRTWKLKGENTDDRSSYFCAVNWGKKSIAVDLNTAEGKEIVHELSKKSDVVIASFKPGDASKLAVDFDTLSAVNPKLIYGHITGFGPDNSRAGYDAVVQAEAGFMFMNGMPGDASLKMPVALIDILAAHHLKEGILLALMRREKTGKGDLIEVSLLQAAVASLANQATNWLVAGVIPQKQGSAHPNIAPYGDIFKTADNREILLAIGSDQQFKMLCSILNISESSLDLSFRTNELRIINRELLLQSIQTKIELIPLDKLVAAFDNVNLPYGIIKNIQDVFQTPEAQMLLLKSIDRMGVRTYIGKPYSTTESHFLPPPHLGEHSQEILSKMLAMTPAGIKRWAELGIIA